MLGSQSPDLENWKTWENCQLQFPNVSPENVWNDEFCQAANVISRFLKIQINLSTTLCNVWHDLEHQQMKKKSN